MFKVCTSYSEQSAQVAEPAEACASLKRKLGHSAPDARTVALENIIGVTRAAQMILNLLDSWTRGDEVTRQAIPQLVGLQTVTVEGVRIAGDLLNKSSRLGFVVLAQFQIENAFRNIARELHLPPAGNGFYRAASGVLGTLAIPISRMEILNTPARIRNSLHSNGIHHRQHSAEPSRSTIDGVAYDFIDGMPVTCASWEHIAHSLKSSVGVLEEVFLSPAVVAMADPMMDQYAWEQETK